MYPEIITFLSFLNNNPFVSISISIALICIIIIIVKLSRYGLLQQYQLGPVPVVIGQPNLIIRWTGPVNGSHKKNPHQEVFTKSLDAAKYGTTCWNMKAYTTMMELNGYTNISIEEYQAGDSFL
jgi:hypothetical protein